VAEGDLTKLEKSLNMSNPKMQLLLEGKKKVHSPKKTDQNLLVNETNISSMLILLGKLPRLEKSKRL
jgi:hypothetical protein